MVLVLPGTRRGRHGRVLPLRSRSRRAVLVAAGGSSGRGVSVGVGAGGRVWSIMSTVSCSLLQNSGVLVKSSPLATSSMSPEGSFSPALASLARCSSRHAFLTSAAPRGLILLPIPQKSAGGRRVRPDRISGV